MISKQAALKQTEMLPAMPIDMLALNNSCMRAVEVVDVCVLEPADHASARVIDWIHAFSPFAPNAQVNRQKFEAFWSALNRQLGWWQAQIQLTYTLCFDGILKPLHPL